MPKNASKKKTKEIVKQELLNSVMENDEMEEPGLEERINKIIDLEEAITMVKKYGEIIRTKNKNVINFVGKQVQLFKKVKRQQKFL